MSTMQQTLEGPVPSAEPVLTPALTFVMAVACGAMVANLYFSQALIGLIGPALGLNEGTAGLTVTLTQLGYGAGLLFIVSLADLVENRRLILFNLGCVITGLVIVALSTSASVFLVGSFLAGFGSVGAQILVPFAAHIAPEAVRGRVIGNIMAGLLTGIMLARPAANMIADLAGWRAVFVVAAVLMTALMAVLARTLPERWPRADMHYGQILLSTLRLLRDLPLLRRRTAYQSIAFATFNLFWTAVPLALAQSFGLGQRGIALFALAGAGGALAAPMAGRLADRGLTRPATGFAIAVLALSCLLAGWATAAGLILVLVVTAVTLDAAVQTNQVISQRAIYSLSAEARGRLNAAYMTVVFVCGALGSLLGAWTFSHGGWRATALTGVAMSLAALVLFATEFRPRRG
ncbi:MFS transporter [Marinivivus vitaminiproducens]|uniref:MFS transporter n=1 Tax=Marinivivus vitaminiproducens TaxID=3035935 RepID=UPI00279FAD07|nr:MFS transporter [Geminicoccaceae bacterium SCSIO 64248]